MLIYPPAWLHGRRQCRARVHGGHRRCEGAAVGGKEVCRLHGGMRKGGSAPGRDLSAMQAGNRKRFVERRARIAAGLPVARAGRLKGHRHGEPYVVAKARWILDQEVETLKDDASEFAGLRRLAIATLKETLLLPGKLADFATEKHPEGDLDQFHKRRRLLTDTAAGVVANAIKIDDQQFRQQEREDLIDLMQKKLALIKIPQKGD